MRIQSLRSLLSFITFDHPSEYQSLNARFTRFHERQCKNYSSWPQSATRQLLINDYWYKSLLHYSVLIFGCIFISLLAGQFDGSEYATMALIAILLYLPLYLLLYRPIYLNEFLPKLETVIAEFEGNQRIWVEKCKQEQLSTRGLVLLYYILDKCAEINYLTPSDKSASLLLKLFGVSQKGLKNELDLLFKKEKRAKIEQRKQTEIAKSFEEVYAILEEMQFPKGIQMLKELEIRFNRPE